MENEIKIYKDEKLLDLSKKWAALIREETGFFLSKRDVNESGRTMKDVAADMIEVYRLTNDHLKNQYPENAVAKSWIGVNEFSSRLVRETWL